MATVAENGRSSSRKHPPPPTCFLGRLARISSQDIPVSSDILRAAGYSFAINSSFSSMSLLPHFVSVTTASASSKKERHRQSPCIGTFRPRPLHHWHYESRHFL